MKHVCLFLFFLLFAVTTSVAQMIPDSIDSIVLEKVVQWSQVDTSLSAEYFNRTYREPLQPSQSYIYKKWYVYHFPDRCIDNILVVDIHSLEVDMCVGECEWMYDVSTSIVEKDEIKEE